MFVLQKIHLDYGRNKISLLCYHHFYCSLEYLFSVSITFIVVMCPCSQSRLSFIDPVISCCWTELLFCLAMVWFGKKLGRFLRELGSGDFSKSYIPFIRAKRNFLGWFGWSCIYFLPDEPFINVIIYPSLVTLKQPSF